MDFQSIALPTELPDRMAFSLGWLLFFAFGPGNHSLLYTSFDSRKDIGSQKRHPTLRPPGVWWHHL